MNVLIAPAKKVAANELASIYLDSSGSWNPSLVSTVASTGTNMIPPPMPSKPLRKPPNIPKKKSVNRSV